MGLDLGILIISGSLGLLSFYWIAPRPRAAGWLAAAGEPLPEDEDGPPPPA
jgi:hypothetical protein